MRRLALGLALSMLAVAPAAAEITLKLPPPELGSLLPLAAPPLDKPPVPLPPVALPVPPQALPELPPPPLVSNLAHRPVAPLPPPRLLACNPIGTVFGVASELLECGRARYQRGELEEAREAFESAVQGGGDGLTIREARYWLGETLLRLTRIREVERVLLLVAQDDPRSEPGYYAAHTLAWVALELGEPARALLSFERLLRAGAPPALIAHARHGRAMALYGLGRYAEARDEWTGLLAARLPRPVAAEAGFWLGETRGRLGDYKGAVARLGAFTAGGPQLLIESGLLRLGWWGRAAGQPLEAVKTYRTLLSAYPRAPEARWARVGLALALLDLDDFPGAREEARRLEDQDAALALPTLLLMSRWTAEKARVDQARALDDELLARTLQPATRAYVLLLSAEVARAAGQSGEARDRLGLVRAAPGTAGLGLHARLRLAQLDFEAREFAQARALAQQLLTEGLTTELRAAALVLAGESAYWARSYEQAAGLYGLFLSDFPGHPQAPPVALALGWAELRGGKPDAARQRWVRFAQDAPAHPQAPAALLLAAELAARAGDPVAARTLMDRMLARYPQSEHAPVAALNRAIVAIRAGRAPDALPELTRLVQGAPLSPSLGRMRLARGIALLAAGRPADARSDFLAALGQGEDAVSHLGLGVVAFAGGRWEEAAREFAEGRDAASGAAAATAEYALAAVAFNQGRTEEFKRFATGLLARPADLAVTPHLLHGLGAVAAEEKRWPEARARALELVRQYPNHDAAVAALAALGAVASRHEVWPLAREMYQTLADRYPGSAGNREGRLDFGEALLRTGAAPGARAALEAFVNASAGDPRMPRAMMLLAQAQEAAGDRAAALDTYARFAREFPAAKEMPLALLGEGRVLQAESRWSEAHGFLERALDNGDALVAGEAAYLLGEGHRAGGQHQEAVEAYMTAAYVAPDSPWARRALLGAGQSFAALKQTDSAAIVYRKLLSAARVEPELADAARRGLRALGAK